MSLTVTCIIIAILIVGGLTTVVVSIPIEKSNKIKLSNKMLLVGSIMALLGMLSMYYVLNIRYTDNDIKSETETIQEYDIFKIDTSSIYTASYDALDYVNGVCDVEILVNNDEYSNKVLEVTNKKLIDSFIEMNIVSMKYIVYVDEDTAYMMNKLIDNRGLIWSNY